MDTNDKTELHMKLFDGEKIERVRISSTGNRANFEDKQKTFSLADNTQIVRHYEQGIGFGNIYHWISGVCHNINLSDYMFKDTAEAIDICVTASFVGYLLNNIPRSDPDFANVLVMRKAFSDFLFSRYCPDRTSRVNIDEKLVRFDYQPFMTDEEYNAYTLSHIEAKKQIEEYKNSREFVMGEFVNDEIATKKEQRKQKLARLKEKFLGKFSSASRSKRRIMEQTQAFANAITGTNQDNGLEE